MSGAGPGSLPTLGVADFGPGRAHVAEAFVQDKVFAILRADDPGLSLIPNLVFSDDDPYVYVFVHGSESAACFQNLGNTPTHEIPATVIAQLLMNHFGGRLVGTLIRVCTCYGNLVRTGESATAVQFLARELPFANLEGYPGLVILQATPASIRLGQSVTWDPLFRATIVVGPPGSWEVVTPETQNSGELDHGDNDSCRAAQNGGPLPRIPFRHG